MSDKHIDAVGIATLFCACALIAAVGIVALAGAAWAAVHIFRSLAGV